MPIAIVGLACRFPEADDADAFWRLLERGDDVAREIPAARFDIDRWYDPDPNKPGTICTRRGAFLADIEHFDPTFFGIPPRVAAVIDPQQRLVLEVGWTALEHAGIPPNSLRNRPAGVFIGISEQDYARRVFADPARIDLYSGSGNQAAFASGRLAHILGATGPAESIDTACSSSLVAIHRACLALATGECELALTGGVHVMLGPEGWIMLSRAKALSPDGRSKAFDASANGFARGEGCGMLVLKRLADAERDHDRVLAVIRGSAVNNDGPSVGLTVPSAAAQTRLLRAALSRSRLTAADVSYLEAHGTGTSLGDPIEVHAAAEAFGADRSREHPLLLGSVKSNIGHLEPAAGVAGVIKVVLAMQHGVIPAHLHCRKLNPRIPWAQLPFRVVTEATPWPRARRIAGISSFGMSGTNAHLLIEGGDVACEALPTAVLGGAPVAASAAQILPLSARNGIALGRLAARWRDWLEMHPDAVLADLCSTAACGRAHFGHRAGLVATSASELAPQLNRLALKAADSRAKPARAPTIAFLFTGQGSQYPAMARTLYDAYPVFRDTIDHCAAELTSELDIPLTDLLLDPDQGSCINNTRYAQPALFAFEMALVTLWRSLGIEPTTVLGHSLGEYSAACAAGFFDLDEGLRLVAVRGALMGALPGGGAMAAVFATQDAVAAVIAGSGLEIAADNGGHQVISGSVDALVRVLAQLDASGVHTRRLAVSHAFHSALLEPILGDLEAAAARITQRPPRCTLIGNMDGRALPEGTSPNAGYWRRHSREPVRFAASIAALAETGCDLVLEIGPQATLSALAVQSWPGDAPRCIASSRRDRPDAFATAVAEVYAAGADLDWAAWYAGQPFRRTAAPHYPFARERHWLDDERNNEIQPNASAVRPAREAGVTGAKSTKPALHRLDWRPVQLPRDTVRTTHWRLLGDARLGSSLGLTALPDVAALLAELDTGAPTPKRLLIDVIGTASTDPQSPGFPEQAHAVAAAALDDLKRLLTDARLRNTALVWITRGAISVGVGDAPTDLAHAPLWGLLRSARNEHQDQLLRAVDLPPSEALPQRDKLMALLAADAEAELAWRQGSALTPRLTLVTTDDTQADASASYKSARALDPNRPVLITGAFGGIGAALARHLVQRHGVRSLVLTSRSGSESPGAAALIAELEGLGADVTAVACDIGDRAQSEALIASHPLGAIFHLAAVLDDGILNAITTERLARVLRPKLDGAWRLHCLTRKLDLSAFVLFSSIAGILGARGQASYAAANTFLDALAAARQTEGLPALSLAWGLWDGAGMSAGLSDVDRARIARNGIAPLAEAEALALLDLALDRPDALLVPLRASVGVIATSESLGGALASGATSTNEAVVPTAPRFATLPPIERRIMARRLVAGALAQVLGHADAAGIDPQTGFTDLGLDSLLAVELRDALQSAVGVQLPVSVTFDHPSIDQLTDYLITQADNASQAKWSDSAIRRKLARTSIDALRSSGLLDTLMATPDADISAATNTTTTDGTAMPKDEEAIMQALETELGMNDER